MNCLEKKCLNDKICIIYKKILELHGVIYNLSFDCEYFAEPERRRREVPQKIFETETEPIQRSEIKNELGRCDFCNNSFLKKPDGIYTCSSCGKTACPSCQGEISQECDLATNKIVNTMLCKECFKKEVTCPGPSASGLD